MHYLLDKSKIAKTENARLVLGKVKKSVTEAFWLDRYAPKTGTDIPDWERRVSILYPTVIYDENGKSIDGTSEAKYKIWYFSSIGKRADESVPTHPAEDFDWIDRIIDRDNSRGVPLGDFKNTARGVIRDKDGGFALLYMESSDGIHFRRPDCHEFYYKKENGEIVPTNIVFIGEHGTGVVKNTHPKAGADEPLYLFACACAGVGISYSDDGIHWEPPVRLRDGARTEIFMPCDAHNQIYYSSELSRYVIFTRGYLDFKTDKKRVVLSMRATDELSSLRELSGLPLEAAAKYFTEPKIALRGEKNAQPYSAPIYHAADGCYLGILSVANLDEGSEGAFHVHASLIFSPDGETWERVLGNEPFIPNAEAFSFRRGNDYGMIYAAAPVNVKGETKIFYAALPELHYFSYEQIPEDIRKAVDKRIPRAAEARSITRTTTLAVATLPRDRFAGYFSEDGSIETAPVTVDGEGLYLNAAISRGGSLSVSLLDEDGRELEGYRAVIRRGGIKIPVRFKESLAALSGKRVRLRLSLRGVAVYTFRFA